jgi:hypothetical protein
MTSCATVSFSRMTQLQGAKGKTWPLCNDLKCAYATAAGGPVQLKSVRYVTNGT